MRLPNPNPYSLFRPAERLPSTCPYSYALWYLKALVLGSLHLTVVVKSFVVLLYANVFE